MLIKEAINESITELKDWVGGAIDKIKGFLNFKWAFPKLKMPHFKIKWVS